MLVLVRHENKMSLCYTGPCKLAPHTASFVLHTILLTWALGEFKMVWESPIAVNVWCWRLLWWNQRSATLEQQDRKDYFHHKLHTNSLSNKATVHNYQQPHLLTLPLNLPPQVQKIKSSLMKHCWLVHENVPVMLLKHGFLEGRWGKGSVFFLISAQACLFCRCPRVLSRRKISKSSIKISKSSMSTMNKSPIYLKEWNVFSIANMEEKCARLKGAIDDIHPNWCPERKAHLTHHLPSFPHTHPFPFTTAVREPTRETSESRLRRLPSCATLGTPVNFSICCFYIELEWESLSFLIFLWTLSKKGITRMLKKILPATFTAALWGYTGWWQHRTFSNSGLCCYLPALSGKLYH